MKKKLIIINCLILVILLCVTSLVGCIGWFLFVEPTDLSVGFTDGDKMFSCAAESNTRLFNEKDVTFTFYFGHGKIPEPFTDMMSIIVVFLKSPSAIYYEDHDDYKNIPDFFIAREFSIVEFFSDNYAIKANKYGTSAYAHHEKFTVPQELYMSPTQNAGEFYFAVLSVKFNLITHKYNFLNSEYSIVHLITFDYQMLGNGKIKLSEGDRPHILYF